MQIGRELEFDCLDCKSPVPFSVLREDDLSEIFSCPSCQKQYAFDLETRRKLKQFADLCKQIHESKEILGDSAVAIAVNSREVKVPLRLLLTRLSSVLDLKIGNRDLSIRFRLEPIAELDEIIEEELLV